MSQYAVEKTRNIKSSVEKYLYDNLYTTEGISMDFEGMPFESGSTSAYEWVQPRIISVIDPPWHPKSASNSRGNTASFLLNMNCFANRENVTAANRHYVLRDTVNKYLHSGVSIPLRDYAGGTTRPWSCLMTVREIETDTPIPNEDVLQYNYTVRLEFLREWENS